MTWIYAVERAVKNNVPKVEAILKEHPYLLDLAMKVREGKTEVLRNLDRYVEETIKSVEKSGGRAHLVSNAEEAKEIVSKIVGTGKTIVLGKSMVAYEAGLRKHLEAMGNDVWETDLGEFLIQLADEPPSHIIAPSLHMTKERAEEVMRKIDNELNNSTHEKIAMTARKFLRDKFIKAHVGITGANAVAADTGSVILVENEGNIRMTTVLPEVHIAVAGLEKILPNLQLALYEALVQAAFGGLYPPSYVNVSSGPSSTADIEMKRVSPAHGPREFHLVLLDNGRREAAKDPVLWESLLCVRCGRCHLHCPVYRVFGGKWGVPPYSGPMGAMWSAVVYRDFGPAQLCVHSGGCREVCPMKIDIPKVLEELKKRGLKQ
ncbi:(Fe-S)-binding protein [Sulfodiicoccus acidiphilus]|uniref:(Fe-S)-binding protein n=1 Tax=Sulfodiicoccus acidiphilus TaxID=1670455 RepID=A0A348B456_9CREN|nr:lactate utilization protein B [Sulfodiicoccus acidiphilus]BBD72958.1 (Fe-S)-binding protein [Sulfodiicoccus acidiphilus]GGT87721.1 (Fe-S)-binding protein [Sulfodiicoccus acidiphilus]